MKYFHILQFTGYKLVHLGILVFVPVSGNLQHKELKCKMLSTSCSFKHFIKPVSLFCIVKKKFLCSLKRGNIHVYPTIGAGRWGGGQQAIPPYMIMHKKITVASMFCQPHVCIFALPPCEFNLSSLIDFLVMGMR